MINCWSWCAPGLINSSGNCIQIEGGAMGNGDTSVHAELWRVLQIPWHGRFMCPFAVAMLGLRYLRIIFLLRLGHPVRNPFLMTLRRVKILVLHSDCCANLTQLARVLTKCVNNARVTPGCSCSFVGISRRAWSCIGADCGRAVCVATLLMGSIHKLVACILIKKLYHCLRHCICPYRMWLQSGFMRGVTPVPSSGQYVPLPFILWAKLVSWCRKCV